MKKVSLTLLASAVLLFSSSAIAASWTVGSVTNYGCYNGGNRVGGAKYCHNCLSAGGDRVVWTFEALCNGNVESSVTATLSCSRGSIPAEGDQNRSIKASATSRLPKKGCAVHEPGTKNKQGTKKKG